MTEFKTAAEMAQHLATIIDDPQLICAAVRRRFPKYAPEQAREIALRVHARGVEGRARWHAHYENRLAYEKAMLEEQGESKLLDKKPRPELKPLLNYRAKGGAITTENQWNRGESITYPQVDMTKAEYAALYESYRGTRYDLNKTHRIRVAIIHKDKDGKRFNEYGGKMFAGYLTDQKETPAPSFAPDVAPVMKLS